MVSIPDWSRLGPLLAAARKPDGDSKEKALSRYQRQQEREAIRQAAESGYFFIPDKNFLTENCADDIARRRKSKSLLEDENKWREKQLQTIKLVKLGGVHIRQLGDITLCRRLRICRLGYNHIQKLDGLQYCRQLLWLDLHGNQLTTVPGQEFWSCFKHLLLLNLHDNPLSSISTVHSLASASCLAALTLHDTPLALKRNYRHHVVNTIWSLKALDKHVISDEEIIEDASFGGRFAALADGFMINICPSTDDDLTYTGEMSVLRKILGQISRILSKFSPVLMVQKHFRGFLTRKRFRAYGEAKEWAAITIQRSWRHYRGSKQPPPSPNNIPPPPTRSPKARDKQEFNIYLTQLHGDSRADGVITPLLDVGDSADVSITKKQNLLIDLVKLQSDKVQKEDEDIVHVDTVRGQRQIEVTVEKVRPKPPAKMLAPVAKEQKAKKKKHKRVTVKQMLGKVVNETVGDEVDDENIPDVAFRLKGKKPKLHDVDPTAELLLMRREIGREIRDTENEIHMRDMLKPKPKLPPQLRRTDIQKKFGRIYGNMTFSAPAAVDAAYSDRAKAEKLANKAQRIANLREERETAKARVQMYQHEKKLEVIKAREKDRASLLALAERRRHADEAYIYSNAERRSKLAQEVQVSRANTNFAKEFGAQYSSVSNALQRHERSAKRQDKQNAMTTKVQAYRADEQERRKLVQRYLEHRQLMRQAEISLQRSAMDANLIKQSSENLLDARSRVSHLQNEKMQMNVFTPLSSARVYPHPDRDPTQMFGLDRYNSTAMLFDGHVGSHHPTAV